MTNTTSIGSGKRFYTPKEVADLLNVSPTTVMSRIHAGALPAVRVSDRIYRIPVPALERFLSTVPTPSFKPEIRRVERVRKLGEELASHADDLVPA